MEACRRQPVKGRCHCPRRSPWGVAEPAAPWTGPWPTPLHPAALPAAQTRAAAVGRRACSLVAAAGKLLLQQPGEPAGGCPRGKGSTCHQSLRRWPVGGRAQRRRAAARLQMHGGWLLLLRPDAATLAQCCCGCRARSRAPRPIHRIADRRRAGRQPLRQPRGGLRQTPEEAAPASTPGLAALPRGRRCRRERGRRGAACDRCWSCCCREARGLRVLSGAGTGSRQVGAVAGVVGQGGVSVAGVLQVIREGGCGCLSVRATHDSVSVLRGGKCAPERAHSGTMGGGARLPRLANAGCTRLPSRSELFPLYLSCKSGSSTTAVTRGGAPSPAARARGSTRPARARMAHLLCARRALFVCLRLARSACRDLRLRALSALPQRGDEPWVGCQAAAVALCVPVSVRSVQVGAPRPPGSAFFCRGVAPRRLARNRMKRGAAYVTK